MTSEEIFRSSAWSNDRSLAEDCPTDILASSARERGTGYLMRHVIDGAVTDRCASRGLESALAYDLLLRTQHDLQATARLADYLRTLRAGHTGFDQVLATLALNPTADHASDRRYQQILGWLNQFEHFTAQRKRLLLETVLSILNPSYPLTCCNPDEIQYRGFAPWVELSQCAARLIAIVNRGDRGDAELNFLEDRLKHGSDLPVWEGNLLAHLLALAAVQRTAPGHPLVEDGLGKILAHQNADGGIPFIVGLEIFCTATAGLAFVSLPELNACRAALDCVTRSMGDYLADCQRPDGGWAYAEGVRHSDVDDTVYCMQFLYTLDKNRYGRHLQTACDYLVGIVNDDGGFPTLQRGHASEAAMTAGAVTALQPHGHQHIIRNARTSLLSAQESDGTFGRSWSLSATNGIYRATQALLGGLSQENDGDRITRTIAAATEYLNSAQHPDGGWGQVAADASDVISTSYALLALRTAPSSAARHRGRAFLLAAQHSDGGYHSRPDQAAPRPLPYEVPILATICALRALNCT